MTNSMQPSMCVSKESAHWLEVCLRCNETATNASSLMGSASTRDQYRLVGLYSCNVLAVTKHCT